MKVKSLSHVRLLATPWTAAHQASPSMGFSRQEYWSGVHCLLRYIGTKKPKMSHDQSCDIGFIAVAWNRTGDLSEACLCVPKCSCPREAFYTTSSRAIVLLYIRECFPWQVKDEIWKQEGSGLSTTSLPASEYQCEPLCEAGKGPSAAFFLLFTKYPEFCSLSDHF